MAFITHSIDQVYPSGDLGEVNGGIGRENTQCDFIFITYHQGRRVAREGVGQEGEPVWEGIVEADEGIGFSMLGFDIPRYYGEELYVQEVGGQGVAIVAEWVFQYAERWVCLEVSGKREPPEAVLSAGEGGDIE